MNMEVSEQLAVTVRELSRCAAALLDEVEKTGRRIVISRYGRAAAVLAPIGEDDAVSGLRRWHVAPRYEDWGRGETDVSEMEDSADIEALDDLQIEFLRAIGDASPHRWSAGSRDEFTRSIMPVTRLEFARFVEGEGGTFWITDSGRRALQQLRDAAR